MEKCEEEVKERSRKDTQAVVVDERAPSMGARALCIPHAENKEPLADGTKCIQCGEAAKYMVLWGRSFNHACMSARIAWMRVCVDAAFVTIHLHGMGVCVNRSFAHPPVMLVWIQSLDVYVLCHPSWIPRLLSISWSFIVFRIK